MEYPKFKVHVICRTYNQSDYIIDALNGFVMQNTDFPYVCSIIDDASTDGEQEKIRKYVETNFDLSEDSYHYEEETDYAFVTYARHKINRNCYFAILYLKDNHYSQKKPVIQYLSKWRELCEYEAICEGDDWWIEPTKLQVQVDCMDNNHDLSLCHTKFRFFENGTNVYRNDDLISKRILYCRSHSKDIVLAILNSNYYRIQTCSALYRLSSYNSCAELRKKYQSGFLMGDTQLWCCLLKYGGIQFIPVVTCVYRIHENSACRATTIKGRLRFLLSASEMRLTILKDFGYAASVCRSFQKQYIKSLANYFSFDRYYQPFVPVGNRVDTFYLKICQSRLFAFINRRKFILFYTYLLPRLKALKASLK